ncbi:hypothetical protein BSPWISOXPB_7183 [uncultured Gammaproteobacteria bacterium]|nr:hypothetical protein BSPWISOXPB_7183 [uncultured Gammaproteobacteria bacterium]
MMNLKRVLQKVILNGETTVAPVVLVIHMNTHHLMGFQDLINMGKEVIQLIAREMLEEDNFFILVLYENLQKNAKLTITNIEDLLPLENEQSRARRTIHLYLQSL